MSTEPPMTHPIVALGWHDPYVVNAINTMRQLTTEALMTGDREEARLKMMDLAGILAAFPPKCSFCEATTEACQRLVAGPPNAAGYPEHYICNLCVSMARELCNAP